jgi:hypothetical protein
VQLFDRLHGGTRRPEAGFSSRTMARAMLRADRTEGSMTYFRRMSVRLGIGASITLVGIGVMTAVLWGTSPRFLRSQEVTHESVKVMKTQVDDWWFAASLGHRGLDDTMGDWIREAYEGEVPPTYWTRMTAETLPDAVAELGDAVSESMVRVTWAALGGAAGFWVVVLIFSTLDYGRALRLVKILPSAATYGLVIVGLMIAALLAPVLAVKEPRAWIFSIPLALGAIGALLVPLRKETVEEQQPFHAAPR